MRQPEKIAPEIPPSPAIVAPDEDGAAYTVLEASLPEQLGVARDLIRAIRQHQLTEGVDWVKRHKDILLTSEAVEKIGRALALITDPKFTNTEANRPGTLAPEAEAGEPPEGPGRDGDKPLMGNREAMDSPSPTGNAGANNLQGPKVEVFKVLRSVFKNSFMVSAFDPAEPKRIVWVRVKDNSKWVPGMTIHATHLQHDQYVLHGNNPRWRGKV